MPIITLAYYAICAYLVFLLFRNYFIEKKNIEEGLHYLIVLMPLVLRLLRIK